MACGQAPKLLIILGASIAAMFLNPFGYRLVLYPFDFLFRQQSNMQYVEEWQGMVFASANGKLALFVVLGLLALNLLVRRRWRLDEVLLMAFALWAALSHTRFLFLRRTCLSADSGAALTLVPALRSRTRQAVAERHHHGLHSWRARVLFPFEYRASGKN